MEQARYWMWAKRSKPDSNINILAPTGDSWEEQAFAEDAAGALGGCVWPPRSYSCSFCRREFRSAQALGGHMNVHRRDRARLKQSPAEAVPHALNPCTSFDAPPQICTTFLYHNNPNPELSFASPISQALRVSSSSPPNLVQKNHKDNIVFSHISPSWSTFLSGKRDRVLETIKNDDEKISEKEDCVTEDLSVSLNLVVCQTGTNNASSDEEVASCKRRRIEAKPLNFLTKLSQSKLCSPQDEQLDLELRLGNAPKVK